MEIKLDRELCDQAIVIVSKTGHSCDFVKFYNARGEIIDGKP